MSSMDERVKGLTDKVAGKAKRALGELTGRPDIVIEGEAQEMLGHRETLAAKREAEAEKRKP